MSSYRNDSSNDEYHHYVCVFENFMTWHVMRCPQNPDPLRLLGKMSCTCVVFIVSSVNTSVDAVSVSRVET